MASWPTEHPDILTIRYEDFLGNEISAFGRIFEHYGLSALERRLGLWLARRHALSRRGGDPHIRNPSSGQWREHFTPRVRQVFDERYGELIRRLGYPEG